MLASSGESIPPAGVPVYVSSRSPSAVMIPALRNALTSASTRLSLILVRLRARIKDKRVLALVKAFLKAGIMTADGDREETYTGTPAGGILSPLLANIALSALDDHFTRQWQEQMGTRWRREKRRLKGLG